MTGLGDIEGGKALATPAKKSRGWCTKDALLTPTACILGVVVGLALPGNPELSPSYRPISSVIGWIYFFNWCISFWPQAITNFSNKSTIGLAPDKLMYDIIGFAALTIYETFMFCSPWIRNQYKEDHGGIPPEVQINDVWFAWHSSALTLVVIFQMWHYDGAKQCPSPPAWLISGILLFASIIGLFAAVMFTDIFTYLDWLYLLSSVKVVITILKFLPQVLLNIRRKSTKGWNIHGCWMDLIGAVLSILQFFLDCYDMDDWEGVAGNFVKLCLGVVSGSYDLIFIVQHYIIYPHDKDDEAVSNTISTTEIKPTIRPKDKEIALGMYSKVDQDDEDLMLGDNVFCDEEMDEFNDMAVVTSVVADIVNGKK